MGKTAVSYCRTSSRGQADAKTIESQRAAIPRLLAKCEATLLPYGPRGDGKLEDDGRSGRLLGEREFRDFIDDLEANRIKPVPDFLILPEGASRLAREMTYGDPKMQMQSALDVARINAVLRIRKVRIVDTKGVHDDVRHGTLHASVEGADIRERTMAGKSQKLGEGRRTTGGFAPYGCRLALIDANNRKSGWKLERHPDNAPNLLKLIDLFLDKKHGYASAAEAAGFPTARAGHTFDEKKKGRKKAVRSGKWSARSVRYLMERVADGLYTDGVQAFTFGGRTHNDDGKAHEIEVPVLVDDKLRRAVTRKVEDLRVKARSIVLSTRNIDCHCGAHAHARNSNGRLHVACSKGCGSMRESVFNAALWRMVVLRMLDIRRHEAGEVTIEDYKTRLEDAKVKLKAAEAKRSKLLALHLDGEVAEDDYREQNARLKEDVGRAADVVKDIEERIANAKSKRASEQALRDRLDDLLRKHVRPDVDYAGKRELLNELRDGCGGARLTVSRWGRDERGQRFAEVTLPPFRDLPAVTWRTTRANMLPVEIVSVRGGGDDIAFRVRSAGRFQWTSPAALGDILTSFAEEGEWEAVR